MACGFQPNSTDQRRDELHLSMTMDLYSSIERWEAQTPAEDVWSTFVVLEKGAREPIGEGVDIMRKLEIKTLFEIDRLRDLASERGLYLGLVCIRLSGSPSFLHLGQLPNQNIVL
jgi:hypothetical protein